MTVKSRLWPSLATMASNGQWLYMPEAYLPLMSRITGLLLLGVMPFQVALVFFFQAL